MLRVCPVNENNKVCLSCVDTTNYKKIMHKGTVEIPFWCDKDVILPNNVTFVSNIQWGNSTNIRKKGMHLQLSENPQYNVSKTVALVIH